MSPLGPLTAATALVFAAAPEAPIHTLALSPLVGAEQALEAPGLAAGRGSFPALAATPGQWLAAWQDDRETSLAVYATRVSAAGSLLDAGGIRLPLSPNDPPRVASDGAGYFVFAADNSTFPPVVQYQRVTTAGALVGTLTNSIDYRVQAVASGPGHVLLVTADNQTLHAVVLGASGVQAGPYDFTAPAFVGPVAATWDGTGYLVTWNDSSLRGVRLTLAGGFSGAATTLSVAPGYDVGAASGLGAGKSLVIWSGAGSGARFLTPTFTQDPVIALDADAVAATGSSFLTLRDDGSDHCLVNVVTPPSTLGGDVALGACSARMALASDGTSFLTARSIASGRILGRRVSTAGALLGTGDFDLVPRSSEQSAPRGSGGPAGAAVAFIDDGTHSEHALAAALDTSGNVLGAPRDLGPAHEVDVATGATLHLTVWTDTSAGPARVHASRLSASGVVLDAPAIDLGPGGRPRAAWTGSEFLIAVQAATGVSFRRIDEQGAIGAPVDAGLGGASATLEDLECTSAGCALAIVRSTSFPSIANRAYLLGVGADGAARGWDTPIASSSSLDQSRAAVTWAGDAWLAATTEPGVVLNRIAPDGSTSTVAGQAVPGASGRGLALADLGDGFNQLVSWDDGAAGERDLAAVLMSGDLLASAVFSVAASGADERDPVIAPLGGGRALLVYTGFTAAGGASSARVRGRVITSGDLLGVGCASDGECASQHCVDGVCCDTACAGACVSCALTAGTCSPLPTGPDALCTGQSACDGQGNCRAANGESCSAAASCASGHCVGGVCCASACSEPCAECATSPGVCRAAAAGAAPSTSCAGTLCDGASLACATGCAADADCAATHFCATGGQCTPKKPAGAACSPADCAGAVCTPCASGYCVDGVCCASACTGQCEACDVAGALGTCTPIAGAPHGARTACDAGSASAPCSAATCDGTSRTSCAGHVGSSVRCRDASCANEQAILAGFCDGSGACQEEQTKACAPYVCGSSACNDSCAGEGDCVAGYRCEVATGTCVGGATCDGDHTLTAVDGQQTDCTPFRCDASGCKLRCSVSADCVAGFVCAGQDCVAVPEPAADDGGCGCRAAGERPGDRRAPAVLAALALAWARRRRPVSGGRSLGR